MEFKVDLDVFSGPMDLLLYLVKKHEVDVTEVPIAVIAGEFIAYLDVLEDLAIDQVGEFVELASVLLEIKARALVPRPEETEEPVELVREDLVQRLLEYKQYPECTFIGISCISSLAAASPSVVVATADELSAGAVVIIALAEEANEDGA